MMPKISVLVPVYNVEPYLRRCIDSVLAQDFTDWEMILVDDGSTDGSPQICDEYVENDRRIKVVHKQNEGLPLTRFISLKEAQGDYVVHLDSDDWLLPNALSTLYAHAEEGYDIVRGTNRRVLADGTYTHEEGRFHDGIIGNRKEYLQRVIKADLSAYLWGAIYRRDLLGREDFVKLRGIQVGEDWLENIFIAQRTHNAKCIKDEVYCYFINDNSIMQTRVCSNDYVDRVKKILDETLKDESEHIQLLALCNRMAAYINNFFVPELPFEKPRYRVVTNFLRIDNNEEMVRMMIDNKFLKFIHCLPLFYLYSRFYCLAFKYIRLKGKTRRILK